MTLVSINIRFMPILAGIPRGEASDVSVVVDNFWRLFSVATWKLNWNASVIICHGDKQSLAGF